MKNIFLIFILIASLNCFGQKIFKDSNGKVFEIKELGKHLTDSCLYIAKRNIGWSIPDTTQFREIYKQWFGDSHRKAYLPNSIGSSKQQPQYKYDIEGRSFLTSTKYTEDSYIEARMGDNFSTYLANGFTSFGTPIPFSLILIKQITDSVEIVSRIKQMQEETEKSQIEIEKSESENLLNPIDKNTELALNKIVKSKVKLNKNESIYTNWIINIDKDGLITDAHPNEGYKGGNIISSYIGEINNALINQKVQPYINKYGKKCRSYSQVYINLTLSNYSR